MKYEVKIPIRVVIEAKDKEEAQEEASSYLYEALSTGLELLPYNPEKEVYIVNETVVTQTIDLKEIQ